MAASVSGVSGGRPWKAGAMGDLLAGLLAGGGAGGGGAPTLGGLASAAAGLWGATAPAAADVAGRVRAVVADNLGPGALDRLPRGEFIVGRAHIASALMDAAAGRISAVDCGPAGLSVAMTGEAAGPPAGSEADATAATAIIAVTGLTVDDRRQEITVAPAGFSAGGSAAAAPEWLSSLAAPVVALAASLLRSVYGERLAVAPAPEGLPVRLDGAALTVDLSRLPQVRELAATTLAGVPLLSVVKLAGVRHSDDGLFLLGAADLAPVIARLAPSARGWGF
jgi:hypothetical protein